MKPKRTYDLSPTARVLRVLRDLVKAKRVCRVYIGTEPKFSLNQEKP
jgi:hypothetical protein